MPGRDDGTPHPGPRGPGRQTPVKSTCCVPAQGRGTRSGAAAVLSTTNPCLLDRASAGPAHAKHHDPPNPNKPDIGPLPLALTRVPQSRQRAFSKPISSQSFGFIPRIDHLCCTHPASLFASGLTGHYLVRHEWFGICLIVIIRRICRRYWRAARNFKLYIGSLSIWDERAFTSSAIVAATDIQSIHRGPFAYDRSAPLPNHCSPHFEPTASATHRLNSSRNASRPELLRSWSDKSGSEGFYGKDFMSKQTGDRGPQGSSTRPESDAGRPSTSSAHISHHDQQASSAALPGISPNTSRPAAGIQLPPLPQATNVTSGSFPPPRAVGLPSILNPTTEQEQPCGQRRKADQLDSPPSSVASLPPLNTGAQPARPGGPPENPSRPYDHGPQQAQNRPILTPRSPTFQRPSPYQPFPPPTGTISALKSPFPTSPTTRSYTAESAAPNFPTPPAAPRHVHDYAGPQVDHSVASRRTSVGGNRLNRAPSSSASPSTSYSSFSQPGGLDERQRPMGIPISSASGQNVYQMMTLETTSGTVQLPVDVQAASKVADEKRKRNAGASARFRQRRKEKERESSTTISKLEQRLKAAVEDADFYKRERDYLAGVLLQVPGGDRHFPRPQSPRHRRSSAVTTAMSASGSAGYLSGPEQHFVPRSPDQDRNVRRRTSVHSLPPPPPPPAPMSGPPSTPGFAGQAYARTPLAPQPPQQYHPGSTTLPSPLGGVGLSGQSHLPPPPQPSQHLGPSTLMQAPPQTGPWNPYAARHAQPPPRTQS